MSRFGFWSSPQSRLTLTICLILMSLSTAAQQAADDVFLLCSGSTEQKTFTYYGDKESVRNFSYVIKVNERKSTVDDWPTEFSEEFIKWRAEKSARKFALRYTINRYTGQLSGFLATEESADGTSSSYSYDGTCSEAPDRKF